MISMKSLGIWVLTFLPALIFFFAGTAKLVDPETWYPRFEAWGYPGWFAVVIGMIEVAGAIALLIPKTVALAALILGLNMLGACFTHVNAGEFSQLPVPMALLAMMAGLEYLHRRELKEMLHLRSAPRHG